MQACVRRAYIKCFKNDNDVDRASTLISTFNFTHADPRLSMMHCVCTFSIIIRAIFGAKIESSSVNHVSVWIFKENRQFSTPKGRIIFLRIELLVEDEIWNIFY